MPLEDRIQEISAQLAAIPHDLPGEIHYDRLWLDVRSVWADTKKMLKGGPILPQDVDPQGKYEGFLGIMEIWSSLQHSIRDYAPNIVDSIYKARLEHVIDKAMQYCDVPNRRITSHARLYLFEMVELAERLNTDIVNTGQQIMRSIMRTEDEQEYRVILLHLRIAETKLAILNESIEAKRHMPLAQLKSAFYANIDEAETKADQRNWFIEYMIAPFALQTHAPLPRCGKFH